MRKIKDIVKLTSQPRAITFHDSVFAAEVYEVDNLAYVSGLGMNAKGVRRLIAWLTKYAEWAEGRAND